MGTNDIIALVLIAVVCLAAVAYFIIINNGRNRRILSIFKYHPTLAMALMNRAKLPSVSDLSEEQSIALLTLTDNEWDEWESLIIRAKSLADKYPITLYDFLNEYIPEYKERLFYKNNVSLFSPITQKVKTAITSLLLDELRTIDADPESTWAEKDKLRLSVSTITQKYPEGYFTYCSIKKTSNPTYSEIISDKRQIAELQKQYDESKGYEGWEKKQADFCSKYWQILKDVRSQDGRYTYDVPFKKTNRKGALLDSKFQIWQGFCESFSSFLREKQTESYIERYNKLSEFKNRNRYFYDRVYDEIFQIINKFNEEIQGSLYVIFIDRCKLKWTKRTYDYHYAHIRELIDNSEIQRYNFIDLPSVNDNGNIGGIFILDFVTSNEELKNNCKLIIEHFNKSVPLVGYYSMEKEYDEEELIELAENQEGILIDEDEEKADLEFIKNSLLQIRKHPFYSYIAIPNTWIGEAEHAEETKKKWLEHPDLYFFRTEDGAGTISGEFSIDGGNTYEKISIKGDRFNIDDVAQFTYLLLSKMGLLSEFKSKGKRAVEYMYEHSILAYH